MARKTISAPVRFWQKVLPEPNSGCWLWDGASRRSRGGQYYGVVCLGAPTFKQIGAHEMSYILFVGPIPDGMQIDHLCSTTLCVNPAHLEAVTQTENLRRAHLRKYGDKCQRGHLRNAENSWVETNGKKHCRVCHALTAKLHRERLKEAPQCLV